MDDPAALTLAALELEGLGSGRLAALRDNFGTVTAAIEAAVAGAGAPAGVPASVFARLGRLDHAAAARTLGAYRRSGIDTVCWDDARYPAPLWFSGRAPPPLLFVQGAVPAAFTRPAYRVRAAAVVGTRKPTGRGRALAHELAAAFAGSGVCVVSGLALGIDAAAHEGALAAGGVTVAVLGGGHGHLHPPSHRGLAARMLAAGGALLSEHPPDTRPERHHFPERNRLVSGLSRLVVVVEAGLRSGTFSTVEHALEQQRDVFACPGRSGDPAVTGTLRLLRDGALIVSELDDVLFPFLDGTSGPRPPPPRSGEEEAVLAVLQQRDEATLDDLASGGSGAVGPLIACLTGLELRGLVARTAAGRYRLTADERRRRSAADDGDARREGAGDAARASPGGPGRPRTG